MKLLITGASGFIGRRVVAQLLAEQSFELVTVGRSAPAEGIGRTRHVMADLLAPGVAAELAASVKATHLLHLAWNATPGAFWTAPDNLSWAAASLRLLEGFIAAGGRRAVMAGTCAEYDWTVGGRLSEGMKTEPVTLYGVAKDAVRRLACAAGRRTGVEVAWGRVFWLYGPHEAAGRLVSDVARALSEGRFAEVGEGVARRDFMHVDDVAAAFVAALQSAWIGPFNIGSGSAVPIREIVERLSVLFGGADLVRYGARPTPADEAPLIEADTRILRKEVGYKPRISLAAGLADVHAHWSGIQ